MTDSRNGIVNDGFVVDNGDEIVRRGSRNMNGDSGRRGRVGSDREAGGGQDGQKEAMDYQCGYGSCTPTLLQRFHNAKCLLFTLCLCAITQGIVINGMIPVSISMLEKRFHLSSTESGIFASMYDIAILVVLVPLSYFGGKGHKGRYLGLGMLIMGVGSFICALPQFVTDPYDYGQSAPRDTCVRSGVFTNDSIHECPPASDESGSTVRSLRNYIWVLLLGQIFHGVGASPLYTLGITYIDENTSQRSSPVYLGIYLGFSTVGPALGFIIGGMLLRIYGDVGKVDLSSVRLSVDDPRWYGAWWIGFVMAGAMALAFSIPMFSFARELPEAKEHRLKDVDQAIRRSSSIENGATFVAHSSWRQIKDSFLELLKNPTFTCLMAMQVAEGFLLSGFVNFIPKFIENVFSLSSSAASLITGAIVVPFGFCGNLLGGYLIRRFKLLCRGIILLALGCQCLSACFVLAFLIDCPQAKLAGINTPYTVGSDFPRASLLDPNNCNSDCQCDKYFQPVCNKYTEVTYFSACFAGCGSNLEGSEDTKRWGGCSCIDQLITNSSASTPSSSDFNASMTPIDSVESGLCPSPCKLLPLFFVLFAMNVLCTFTSAMPIQQAELRCVPFHLRTMAVGLRWIFARLIGAIPGVIAFGAAIDTTCIFWDGKCESEKGSCLRYNSRHMAMSIMGFGLAIKAIVITSLFLAWKLYRAPQNEQQIENANPATPVAIAANGSFKSDYGTNKVSPMEMSQGADKF